MAKRTSKGTIAANAPVPGAKVATTGFFQPYDVDKCESCVKNALVNFDFELSLDDIRNGALTVQVEPVFKDYVGDIIPGDMIGNPAIELHYIVNNG